MKKTIFILSLISFTGLQAQTQPIQIEVVDRTEITMLAAQYDIIQREKRQAQAELNYDTANYNREIFASNLFRLYRLTNDKDILKRIKKAEKQNERLLNLYNRSRYSTDFYRLQSVIRQISADIEKLKPSR